MSWTRDRILDRLHEASERFGLNPQQARHIQRTARRADPAEAFAALFAVFEREPRPEYGYHDQEYAGRALLAACPPCPLPLKEAIRRALPNWNVSVEQLPLYFAEVFGKQVALDALAEVERGDLSERERRAVGVMCFWTEQHTTEWARTRV